MTLLENDMIKVHMYDWNYSDHREIQTRNYDKVFRVYRKNGQLGIDWNTEHSLYTSRGEEFVPLHGFADTVIFENVKSGELYHFSNIKNAVVKAEID